MKSTTEHTDMRNIKELVEEVNEVPRTEVVALGTGTAVTIAAWLTGGSVHIALEMKGYYHFAHYAHWTYVMEKLFDGKYQPDAEALADFINAVLERKL